MSLQLAAPHPRPSPAAEARLHFDRMRELATEALGAVGAGDEVTIRRALDERDRLAERIAPLVRAMERDCAAALDPVLALALREEAKGVVEAALTLQEADALLAARLAEARAGVARALDRRVHAPRPAGPARTRCADGLKFPRPPVDTLAQRGDPMRIIDRGADRVRADGVRGARPAADRRHGSRISGAELTPERIAEVRRRILEGAYDSAEVAGQVARSILERGDL